MFEQMELNSIGDEAPPTPVLPSPSRSLRIGSSLSQTPPMLAAIGSCLFCTSTVMSM